MVRRDGIYETENDVNLLIEGYNQSTKVLKLLLIRLRIVDFTGKVKGFPQASKKVFASA